MWVQCVCSMIITLLKFEKAWKIKLSSFIVSLSKNTFIL